MTNNAMDTETLSEGVQLQEIDERHYLALQIFRRRSEKGEGWSQDELAERAGMTQPQIANLEAGQANPTLRTLVKVAHALEAQVGELLEPSEASQVRAIMTWERNRRALSNVRDIPGVRVSSAQERTGKEWERTRDGASTTVEDDGFSPQTNQPGPATVAA